MEGRTMNEKVFITVFTVLLFMCAVVLWFSFRETSESNRRLEDTRIELQSTAERLQRAEARNRELENRLDRYEVVVSDTVDRLGELNSIFAENNNGLHSTIEQLQIIAEEVEALENRLRDIDNNSGGDGTSVDILTEQEIK
jgi:uncharacterized coiled-coil protein SlyX